MRLDAATFLLQWVTGGVLFGWFTWRSAEISANYARLVRAIYTLLALASIAWGVIYGFSLTREVASIAVATTLLVSVFRKSMRLDLMAVLVGAIGLTFATFSSRTGNVAVELSRILVGSAFLGIVTDAMLLGHWYLVQPGMTRRLLNQLTNVLLIIWPLEVLVMILPTGMISVLSGNLEDGWNGVLGYFWLSCALLTGVLAILTRAALKERSYTAVMAATGLSYLAILTAFGTDLVARALLAV